MGFSRQEYWSGLPFPSPKVIRVHTKLRMTSFWDLSIITSSEALFSSEVTFKVPSGCEFLSHSILKKINTTYSLERLMLRMKLQYFGHLMWRADSLEKIPDVGKAWRQEEKRATEDEMVGWHHWCNGHEFEQTLGHGEGQGGLVYCSPWGRKESDTIWWLNNSLLTHNGILRDIVLCFKPHLYIHFLRKWILLN